MILVGFVVVRIVLNRLGGVCGGTNSLNHLGGVCGGTNSLKSSWWGLWWYE
jgi:hypothetical protein